MSRTNTALWIAVVVLALINACIFYALLRPNEGMLRVTFLDVGQGDAILIESPEGAQMLVDGGRDRSVLRELGRELGLLDRSIDVVVATHPDADHIGGLPGVFERYDIGAYLSPGVESETSDSKALAVASDREGAAVVARRGMQVDLGGGTYVDILFPDRDVSKVETNTGSIIMRITYGETAFLLTGDAPESIEDYLVLLDGAALQSDVMKAGHHGSRTSTGEALLAAANPSLVIVSAGRGNSYGHPHEEVVTRIVGSGATVLSTMEDGAVRLVSDGRTVMER